MPNPLSNYFNIKLTKHQMPDLKSPHSNYHKYLCVDNKMEHRVSSSQLNALLDILQENPDVGARRWHWSEIKRGDRPKVARNC
nr:unnamed protein product [Callosobruchus chinensis]